MHTYVQDSECGCASCVILMLSVSIDHHNFVHACTPSVMLCYHCLRACFIFELVRESNTLPLGSVPSDSQLSLLLISILFCPCLQNEEYGIPDWLPAPSVKVIWQLLQVCAWCVYGVFVFVRMCACVVIICRYGYVVGVCVCRDRNTNGLTTVIE